MSKISTEMQNNFSDIVPDIIKEKKFDKLVKEAEKTFKLIEKKNSDNPDVLEKIRKEYRDVIEARNKAQQKESIKWTELVAEEYKILKEEVKDLDKYWEADKANYSYNTGLFLTKDKNWKFISNWKKIPKEVIQKIENNTKIFIEWNISIKNLSNSEIWWMLSWLETLVENWDKNIKEKFINHLSKDHEWLIYLKNNWWDIATNLQFEAKLMKPLINEIIQSASLAINNELINFIKKNNPEINEEELKLILSKVNKKLDQWSNMSEIISILEWFKNKTNPKDFILFVKKVFELSTIKHKFKIQVDKIELEYSTKKLKQEWLDEEKKKKLQKTIEKLKWKKQKSETILKSQTAQVDVLELASTDERLSIQAIKSCKKEKSDIQLTQDLIKLSKEKWLKNTEIKLNKSLYKLIKIESSITLIREKNKEIYNIKDNSNLEQYEYKENTYYETKTYQYPNWEKLVYIETPDWYNIDNWTEWNEWIDITKEEFESIKNKPENLKNLLNFKETLNELNIDFIWEHRFDFIQKLNNIDPTLDIKIDSQNYINNTELKKILNWIIVLSWNEKPYNNINSIKKSLRNISNSWIDTEKKDNKWSPIEKLFIDKWIINKNSSTSYFKIDKMKENYK